MPSHARDHDDHAGGYLVSRPPSGLACVLLALVLLVGLRTAWTLWRGPRVDEPTYLDVVEELAVTGRGLPEVLRARGLAPDAWYRAHRELSGQERVRQELVERLRRRSGK